ncbi:MAG: SPOR domain-containing protein [Bacteroidaceae bacterium]|nr:SPOR domain-containing protein [Bacteroidaceae bacterium]
MIDKIYMKSLGLSGIPCSRACSLLFVICHFLFCIIPVSVHAQQTFTQYLTRKTAGGATVVLHQDAEIDALVNGITTPASQNSPSTVASTTAANSSQTASAAKVSPPDSLSTADSTLVTNGRRLRTNGYRIQVYAGGNNRQSKSEAYRMAALVRSSFSDVQVYTHFISPRWICRVGDFKTYEEATEMLKRMRQTQKFSEASIVKSKIIVLY